MPLPFKNCEDENFEIWGSRSLENPFLTLFLCLKDILPIADKHNFPPEYRVLTSPGR